MKKNVFANMRLMITETDENLQSSSLQMPRHRLKSWENEREDKKKKVLYITQTVMERKNERKRRRTQPTQREREKKIIKISKEEAIKEDLKNTKYNKL